MLMNCPECDRQVSNTVKACPHCGYVLKRGNPLGLIVAFGCLGATVLMGLWFVPVFSLFPKSADTGGMDFGSSASVLTPDPVTTPQWTPPEGFESTQTKSLYGKSKQVGIRWVPTTEVKCAGYMQEGCYQLEVVSEEGCSSLYVSLVQLDSAGANIGYTNDTTSSVAAGQIARLSFSSRGENRVQIGEISCQ